MPDTHPANIEQRHFESQFAGDPLIADIAVETGCQSVSKPSDLPESLRYLKDQLPGVLFWHHPLGGGAPVPQYRPDQPKANDDGSSGPKYIFPKGAGSVISISPTMQARLDADESKSCRVLIVEGTKQALFAAAHAPLDTVVVGIQGCWGWSSDGIALRSLLDLVKGRQVFVAFDADTASNQKVYDAAQGLFTAVTTVGAKVVKFINIPGSKTTGLDDFLARCSEGDRLDSLTNMMLKATTFAKLKKPPRQSKALTTTGDTFDYISEDLGEVIEGVFESRDDNGQVIREHQGLAVAGVVGDRTVRRAKTLLNAAPFITATTTEIDDLTHNAPSSMYLDIDVQIGPKGQERVLNIRDVPASSLKDVRQWLDSAGPDGVSVMAGRDGIGVIGQGRIAEAMRGLSTLPGVEHRTALVRTGWYVQDNVARWVDSTGAHGGDGKITSVRANLEGSLSALSVPAASEFSQKQIAASAKALIELPDFLYDPTPIISAIGGLWWSIAGGHPDGALYFVGMAGSGKTSISSAISSMLGPRWGTGEGAMASIDGTTSFLADSTKQIHNCALVLDDARTRPSEKAQHAQDEAIDSVIRVAYGGGTASRGKKVARANGDWRQSTARENFPFIIIVGETLPSSEYQSTIERCLVIEIKHSTSLKTAGDSPTGVSGYKHFVNVSREGTLRPILASFIQHLAATMSDAFAQGDMESIQDIRTYLEEVRDTQFDEAASKYWKDAKSVSDRTREVTRTFVAGVGLFFEFLSDKGFIDEATATAMTDEWRRFIFDAATSHSAVNLTRNSKSESIIDAVKNAIASGRYCLGIPATPSQTCVGQEVTVSTEDGRVEAIALLPDIVKTIVRPNPVNARDIADALIRDKKGQLKRQAGVNGTVTRCFVVRKSIWNGDVSLDDIETVEPAGSEDF